MGDYTISDIYQGGYSSLKSDYGNLFTGYRTPINKIGVSTDARTASILKEVSDKLTPGQKVIELSLISPENLEAVPKQELEEVKRLSQLTGVDVTVHGPLIDASGVTDRGFTESNREVSERKILYTVEKSHEINPNGNIPVTFHTSNRLPGAVYRKEKDANGKEIEVIDQMPIVNQETGQMNLAKRDVKFYAGRNLGKGEIRDVYKQLEEMNNTEWENALQQMIIPKEHADKILRETEPIISQIALKEKKGIVLTPEDMQIKSRYENAEEQIKDMYSHLQTLFNRAYKYGTEEKREGLKKISKEFGKRLGEAHNRNQSSFAMQKLMEDLRPLNPEIYKPAETFALEKSAQSFGNAAFAAYDKFKDKSPIISIENPPAGFGLSRAEDVKKMVEGSRKQFIMKATEKGMSASDAKKQAEKLIGVTWDVGHINQLRQFGFTSEEIIKEAEKVAPFLKHVHLSDNFGMENVELPMGMGNVDFKEVMDALRKKGGKVDDVRQIVEAAHWWQFQKTSPIGPTFEALGSPFYSGTAPYWNQAVGLTQGYFGGYGGMLPPINYETFGAGFSNLPAELGGQRQQRGGSRMGGTPME
ncbi:MAG: TIM barrel protein [archaeon]